MVDNYFCQDYNVFAGVKTPNMTLVGGNMSSRVGVQNNSKFSVKSMVIAALLCAIGIMIPVVSPVKIPLGVMTFTLGSHIAIFMAMFISPVTAIIVSLGTTVGFLIAGFPIVVVLRALSHIIFAIIGAFAIKKIPDLLKSKVKNTIFAIIIAVIHGLGEILVVTPFFISDPSQIKNYDKGFLFSIVLVVGLGTVIHSLVDYLFATVIWKGLERAKVIK